eukprot:TRINITY_DN26754_c0_g1_i2.p1 TRINITY_DN26754_c0_g1~~TRINITY_DN26754_c0_g1_i2.p1  ORF type:complete len:1151 (+),score=446.78 TRINITY_DN26754_c0_g1_i2:71-3523(+)
MVRAQSEPAARRAQRLSRELSLTGHSSSPAGASRRQPEPHQQQPPPQLTVAALKRPAQPRPASGGSVFGCATIGRVAEHCGNDACLPDCFAAVVPAGAEPRVWTVTGAGTLTVRHSATCDELRKVEGVRASALCATDSAKVWVGRHNGKISVYDGQTGTLETVVQENPSATAPISLLCAHGDRVWSVANSKDIVEWDAEHYCIVRLFFGPLAGDLVHVLCPGRCGTHFALFAGTRQRVYAWGAGGGGLSPPQEGGSRSLAYAPANAQLWSANDAGIIVYSGRQQPLELERVLPLQGRPVRHLLYVPSGNKVWAVDDEQLIAYDPDGGPQMRILRSAELHFTPRSIFVSHRREVTSVWMVDPEGHRMQVWEAAAVAHPQSGPTGAGALEDAETLCSAAAARAEIDTLKKKIQYIQSVGTIFRQRIGILFREKFRQRPEHGADAPCDISEFEGLYRQALSEIGAEETGDLGESRGAYVAPVQPQDARVAQLEHEKELLQRALNEALAAQAQRGGRVGGTSEAERQLRLWRERAQAAEEQLAEKGDEVTRLSVLLRDAGPERDADIKRAQHICQVLREKNTLREREAVLNEEIERLKKQLATSEERFIELKNSVGDALWNSNMATVGARARQRVDVDEMGLQAPQQPVDSEVREAAVEAAVKAEHDQRLLLIEQLQEDRRQLEADLLQTRDELVRLQDGQAAAVQARKQNSMLKARLSKMKQQVQQAEAKAQELSAGSGLAETAAYLQTQVEEKRKQIQGLEGDNLRLMQDVSRLNTKLQRYKAKLLTLEREQISRCKTETIVERDCQLERETLTRALDFRESKIQQLDAQLRSICEQMEQQGEQLARSSRDTQLTSQENRSLKGRLEQLDVLLAERRGFSSLLAEVRARMMAAVEDMRNERTRELADGIRGLDKTISGMSAVDAQLRQKDDLLAAKDDLIQQLRGKLGAYEQHLSNISCVFMQFPDSLADLETLVLESDEYRQMVGRPPEFQERVRLRRLQIEADRRRRLRAGAPIADLGPCGASALDAATAAMLARTAPASSSDDDDDLGPLPPRRSGTSAALASSQSNPEARAPAAARMSSSQGAAARLEAAVPGAGPAAPPPQPDAAGAQPASSGPQSEDTWGAVAAHVAEEAESSDEGPCQSPRATMH